MSNQLDNALEAVRSAVVNAAELGLTRPEITHAVASGLHTNNHPRTGHEEPLGTRSRDPIEMLRGHGPLSGDDEL
jgi:hypothetical protein